MFIVATGAILVTVILFLVFPFWKKVGEGRSRESEVFHPPSEVQEREDLEMEKDRLLTSLTELKTEQMEGRLNSSDYERLKVTDESRLAKILDRLDLLSGPNPQKTPSPGEESRPAVLHPAMGLWGPSILLGLLVSGGVIGIYSHVQGKIGFEAQRVALERQAGAVQGMPNPIEMVARLEARLRENPDDLEGQIMAGRSYMALERFEDAKRAWTKVLDLNRRSHEAHFNLGILLLQADSSTSEDPRIFEQALAHFETALINVPREPAVLWYKGVALVHLKRFAEADESWTTAYQNLPPGSEDAEFVRQALQSLRSGNVPLTQ